MNKVNQERLLADFIRMAKIASPSKREGAFADELKRDLSALGFSVEIDQAGVAVDGDTGNIIATLAGNTHAEPLMLCCHMDTVEPCAHIEPLVDGDLIYTDGTTILSGDDKGGIAAIFEAIRQIKEQNIDHGMIQVVFTIGEEIGMFGSKNLDYTKIQAKQAVVFDAEGAPGTIVVQGPAKNVIKAVIQGKSAHAGLCPENGISAIQVVARAIDQMKLLRIDADTTANIGTISGGEATNIVAETVHVVAEARSLSNEKLAAQSAHMADCFEQAAADFGATAKVAVTRSYDAFHLPPDNSLVRSCMKTMESVGLKPKLGATGGGSDCNVFNGHGITAVDVAVGMTAVHSKAETIKLSDLVAVTRFIIELVEKRSGGVKA